MSPVRSRVNKKAKVHIGPGFGVLICCKSRHPDTCRKYRWTEVFNSEACYLMTDRGIVYFAAETLHVTSCWPIGKHVKRVVDESANTVTPPLREIYLTMTYSVQGYRWRLEPLRTAANWLIEQGMIKPEGKRYIKKNIFRVLGIREPFDVEISIGTESGFSLLDRVKPV